MTLLRRAARWRAQRLRVLALDAAVAVGGFSAAAVVGAVACDQAFSLSQGARWAALAAVAAGFSVSAWRLLVEPWLRFDWLEVMRAASEKYPRLEGRLTAAWDLRRGGSPHTSPQLRQAHLEQTELLLAELPDEPVFTWRVSPRARKGAWAAAAAVLVFPWVWKSPSWGRVLAPWHDVPLERYVRVLPGTAQTDWGKPVLIEARWDQRGPVERNSRALELWIKGASTGWRAAAWDRLAPGRALFTAEGVSEPFVYRLAWRDLRTSVYRLTPVAPPLLESLRARISGADDGILALDASQPLSVMRGSGVMVIGRPNQPLARAALRLSSLPGEIALKPGPDGELSAAFIVREDASLRFDLETPDGRRDQDPPVYALRAVADMPPRAELLSPLQPLQVSPEDLLPISFAARDDGGVAAVSLIVKPEGGAEREVKIAAFSAPKKEYLGDYSWDLSGLPLGKATFRLRAVDNAVPAQAGFSQSGEIELVDFASAHGRMEAQWLKTEESLKALSAREDAIRAKLAAPPPSDPEPDLAAAPRDWNKAVEDFSSLARAMQEDAYANPGMAEAAKQLSEDLARAEKEDLPPALTAARGKDRAAASAAHARLAQRAEAARKMLAEGRKVQGMQDLFSNAGRMSQTSSELSAQLEAAASGAKPPTTGEKRRLDAALSKLQAQMQALQQVLDKLPKAEAAPEAAAQKTFELPVDSARRNADQLAQALARGDYGAAADIARKLSDDLSRIESALGAAAQGSAASSMAKEESDRLQKMNQDWSEALDAQTRAVESARRLDQGRVQRRLEAERKLLEELARRQQVLVSSAAALGVAFRPEVLSWMRAAQAEFEAAKVERAPDLLRAATARLRQSPPEGDLARRYEFFAVSEEAILRKLQNGAQAAAPPSKDQRAAAAREQSSARAKAADLQRGLESFAADGGTLPGGVLGKVEQAQGEQSQAESNLQGGDAPSGLRHGQAALELLSQGAQKMSDAAGGGGSIESGMGRPFQRPGTVIRFMRSGGGMGSGVQLGFVPLPSAKDYAPPRELRQELEKSLREKRPAAYDATVKEYFKRVAQ